MAGAKERHSARFNKLTEDCVYARANTPSLGLTPTDHETSRHANGSTKFTSCEKGPGALPPGAALRLGLSKL